MSFRVAIRAALCAALLLTDSCGGGSKKPPRATLGPEVDSGNAIRFEDLPVTRLARSRVPIPNAANPSLGAANATVVIQMWSDFECPFCADAHPVLIEVLRIYAGKVRLVWRDYPLPFHAHSRLAANAGRAAYAQGGAEAFWKFHDAVYGASSPRLDAEGLEQFAVDTGLDPVRFREALSTQRYDTEIKRDFDSGQALGVTGTPAFLVNDYFFIGAIPLEIMRVVVDRALSDAGA
ncbi:MAG TPA: thioredoxin domain-containing protein [Polyangiaceae bacterium]|nr:thioredoxin domain-containing protein [Polyangiaceae bacterium]